MTPEEKPGQEVAEEEAQAPADEIAAEATVEEQAGVGSQPPAGEALERQLAEARAKADENWDSVLRARAELENLRRRHERDLANAHKFSLERFVADLLLGEPDALGITKRLVYEVPAMEQKEAFAWTADLSARLFKSEKAAAGMKAFLERTKPPWAADLD